MFECEGGVRLEFIAQNVVERQADALGIRVTAIAKKTISVFPGYKYRRGR